MNAAALDEDLDVTTSTPTADLIEYAGERGLKLTRAGAQKLRRDRGEEGARDRIDSIAALVTLASALGIELTDLAAARRLDAVKGNYDRARERLVAVDRARREGIFSREWARLEDAFYMADARKRHAVFVGHLQHGPLGWQASMLLLAAHDAGLRSPNASAYRVRLERMVGAEIERRYPDRRETEWEVVDPDSRHSEILKQAISDERAARDLALLRRPELRQRIDTLTDSNVLRRDVERVLNEIRRRLANSAEEGWHPNPDRYLEDVVQPAADVVRAS
jgi:hypothetical protein